MRPALVLCLLPLTGCASMFSPAMSPEQIKAAVADKSASVVCSRIITAGGSADTIVVNLDQRVIRNGQIAVGDKCQVTVSDMAAIPVPIPEAPK